MCSSDLQSGAGNVFTQDSDTANAGTTTAVDTSAATEARAKRTVLQGGGADIVTIMIYMCGTDLESSYSMATKDLTEMTKASWGDNMHVLVYTGGCSKWRNNLVSSQYNQLWQVKNGKLVCLNDNVHIRNYDAVMQELHDAFEHILPEKSSFEL